MSQVYNFGAGPAMLPIPAMKKTQEEFLNFNNMGISLIEISHRSKEFEALLNQTDALLKELLAIPDDFEILYVHGGAQMQFSAVPLNFMGLKPAKKALYVESGNFAKKAGQEAARFGQVVTVATSKATNYDRIPDLDLANLDQEASYLHITSNNTLFGTRYQSLPDTGSIPLVIDATSELLSRPVDFSKVGCIFAGAQKNLGPAGLAVVIVRKNLLGKQLEITPNLLSYETYAKEHSLANTNNTFAIYMINLVLHWLKGEGGIAAIEKRNEQKAALLYEVLDSSSFYKGHAHKDSRSVMNVTFNLPSEELLAKFLKEAGAIGLYALKGHRLVGGARASIYNAMPVEGCQKLADFMRAFEKANG